LLAGSAPPVRSMVEDAGGLAAARGTPMTTAEAPTGLASRVIWSFLVGALAMLTFHQAAVGLFHAAGMFPVPPFELQPTSPLQVPKVASGAFWSGLWGIVFLMVALPRMRQAMPGCAAGLMFGFLVPVAVLSFVVAPLKGQPIAYAQSWGSMLRIALAHAFWGFGMVVIWQGMREPGKEFEGKSI
jgi:hypothetical protein